MKKYVNIVILLIFMAAFVNILFAADNEKTNNKIVRANHCSYSESALTEK